MRGSPEGVHDVCSLLLHFSATDSIAVLVEDEEQVHQVTGHSEVHLSGLGVCKRSKDTEFATVEGVLSFGIERMERFNPVGAVLDDVLAWVWLWTERPISQEVGKNKMSGHLGFEEDRGE